MAGWWGEDARTYVGLADGLLPCQGLERPNQAIGDAVHHGIGDALGAGVAGGGGGEGGALQGAEGGWRGEEEGVQCSEVEEEEEGDAKEGGGGPPPSLRLLHRGGPRLGDEPVAVDVGKEE